MDIQLFPAFAEHRRHAKNRKSGLVYVKVAVLMCRVTGRAMGGGARVPDQGQVGIQYIQGMFVGAFGSLPPL